MDLKTEIQERDELIKFLREQLIKATGQDVEVPYRWEKYTGPSIAPKFILPQDNQKTFAQAVKDLDLPTPAPVDPKKGLPEPLTGPDHEKISLTHFYGRGLTKDSLLSLIGGMKRLTRIRILDLSRNNLTDAFVPELEEILKFNKITRLNLSNNELGKVFLTKFSEITKSSGTHLEYIE